MGGKTLWVVSTSALLLGVPWALAYSEEQMIVEQERAELQAQRAQNEVCEAVPRRALCNILLTFHSSWLPVRPYLDSQQAQSLLCRRQKFRFGVSTVSDSDIKNVELFTPVLLGWRCMERAEPVHTAARVYAVTICTIFLDSTIMYCVTYSSCKNPVVSVHFIFCAHWLCYYMYKYIVSCRLANVWRYRCFAEFRSTKARIPSDVNVAPFTFINHPSRAHAIRRSFRR